LSLYFIVKLGDKALYSQYFFIAKAGTTERKMRLSLQRTGGFAGISKKAIVDTANLSSEEAQQLSHLLEAANFFNLPTIINAPSNQADRFQYIITVEENNQQYTVKVSEAGLPGSLKQIIEWINARGN
jgi:hypothetical protein